MKNDVSKRKKTSKEKRALIGALCIAAAVAAGSTFAWFSSVDEVTNRLSANAAYDVSIIETFTPPTNWIPGQKVNKDTAAVNTGNIPAFVKQKLEGKMRITLESVENTINPSDTTKTYVELTEDEKDSIEAGGFLAYASRKNEDGSITKIGVEKGETAGENQCYLGEISAVHSGADFRDVKDVKDSFYSEIQFVPPATGDYIFRRVIAVNDDKSKPDEYGTETYEYSGYHFDATTGSYYKIKVINELQPKENGILSDAPKVYYAVETQDIKTLPLRYEAASDKNFLLYNPVGSSEIKYQQYITKTEYVEADTQGRYTKYTIDNGAGGTKSIFVCLASGTAGTIVGKVYEVVYPIEQIKLLGTTSGDATKYDINIKTPDRLIATYKVGKSDDVFIDGSTDLSDFTADNYDAKLAAIAYSDYLIAKADYDNEMAQYELNKNAYEAGVALLDALAKNEEILNKKKTDIAGKKTDFTGSTITNLLFAGDANTTPYTTLATAINNAIGTVDTNSQMPSVTNFINAVNTYQGNPTDTNWEAVVTAYATVTTDFTNGNKKIEALEDKIVSNWNASTLNNDLATKLSDVSSAPEPANASDETKKAKAAASQLKTWEDQIAAYQKAVNKYYSSLSNIQSDSKYDLKDVRGLERKYKEAAEATVEKKGTNAEFDGSGKQLNLATGTVDLGVDLTVDDDYKIKADTTVKTELRLNPDKDVPIKNSISNDGYAGTAIDGITGDKQFKINGQTIAFLKADNNKKLYEPTYDATKENTFKAKSAENEKYKSKHTNQHANDDVVIYINLANIGDGTENNKWKICPTVVPGYEPQTDDDEEPHADFYYTSILGPGEQTSILVDSLELSGDTTNVAFKDFDFDLNVTVDSSQVVVSEDGGHYESTAVNVNDAFEAKPSKPSYKKEEGKPIKSDANCKVDWT